MRKFPQFGGVAVAALAIATGLLAVAWAAGPASRAAMEPVAVSSTGITPGGPLAVTAGNPARGTRNGTSTPQQSTNWAGYIADHATFRYVRAAFFVPYTDCARTPDSYSSDWVGFDGLGNSTVEQTGILVTCLGTVANFRAWYEMYPRLPLYLTIAVHPGNVVVASVYYNSHSGKFTVSLDDTTTGVRFSHEVACPARSRCLRDSAEVISEAPSSGTKVLPLTDFRAESYSGIRVTDQAGQRDGLRGQHWHASIVTMMNRAGTHILDQPTAIYLGRAFGDYWQAS